MLGRLLVVGALAWPALLGAALWDRIAHAREDRSVWSAVVYVAASQVCHQQPERSFQSRGAHWPVCARCAGLYLAAPFGALLWVRRRVGGPGTRSLPVVLGAAALPTLITVGWEWMGLGMPANGIRFAAALPLGAAILHVLLRVTHRID